MEVANLSRLEFENSRGGQFFCLLVFGRLVLLVYMGCALIWLGTQCILLILFACPKRQKTKTKKEKVGEGGGDGFVVSETHG